MKNLILIAIDMVIALTAISQTRPVISEEMRNIRSIKTHAVSEATNQSLKSLNPDNSNTWSEEVIGSTWYDLQSNASVQNRLFLYPDGYIGSTFTFGIDHPAFIDRGTGYNHYDGSGWGAWPTQRIETDRCGWPSYAPWGPTGEIVAAHYSGASTDGLVFSKRTTKGAGSWTEFSFTGPDGHALLWPRMITGGINHETVHLVVLTTPVSNGGTLYQGQDGALVYSRSSDGGATWDIENIVLPGLGSGFYNGFEGDTYEFAYPEGNTIALLIGNDWTDLILMKSTDNGSTWTKTLIWEHPYPLFDPNNMIVTDTFYCADGAHSVAIDNLGKAHVAFGINRAYSDGSTQYWFPLVDGVGYWNEDMPTFSNNLNALSPYGDPESELIEDYNLIGWMQDINGNGELDILGDVGMYFLGASSMPQLVVDDQAQVFLVYSSVTETYDNGIQDYRHIWARGSNNNGQTWGGFIDLTGDIIHIFDECVFPSCSPTTDDNIHFIYQQDNEPGMAVRGDLDFWQENYIHYFSRDKSDIILPDPGNTLTGIVTGVEGGVPIEGADILLDGTAFTATTGSTGSFIISDLPAGIYTVNCSKPGYIDESANILISDEYTTIQNFELTEVVIPQDAVIGITLFDLQSNSSMPNRIYKYDDGTIGAVWTMGLDELGFPDLGTGYNYYNGLEWLPAPVESLEDDRAGWPSYTPWGSTGEIVVSNYSNSAASDGLIISSRPGKGNGDWTMTDYFGPVSSGGYLFPRAVTGGDNHSDLHLIALTKPVYLGGTLYENMNGALLYSRSSDGGLTWNQQDILPDEINSSFYTGFRPETYDICANGNTVAFLVGDEYCDLVLMKSTDNGDSWTKTVIWEHPYPLFDPFNMIQTDTFYCSDGAHSLAIDNGNKVHVAFAITKIVNDVSGSTVFDDVDGIAYWNEDMATFSNNLNALSPYGEPGSELIPDYNLIAWSQDLNGNGELDFLDDWGDYNLGVSSMPQLIVDELDNRYLIYSSVTEGYDNGVQNYRHLWARAYDYSTSSWSNFIDLNQDIIYIFSECVFPSVSPTSDDHIHILFMTDSEPGMAVSGDIDPYGDNYIQYINVSKSDLLPELDLGILSGTVTEINSGYPIAGASITILGTSFSTLSGSDGSYIIEDIPSGNYTVTCEKTDYISQTVTVDILGSYTTVQNFQLDEPAPPVEGQIGETRYDLQSNSSMANRIYKYDDGAIGGVWTMGFNDPSFPDRGTGYNYYNGSSWGAFPTDGIEPDRTGWPSYAPWGQDGEIVVAHYSGASTDGLVISRRQNKGTGNWSATDFYGPEASNYYLWPRATTGGTDHNDLHVIALTTPVSNGGTFYQGMDGALLYSRSPDGGLSWDHEHVLFDEINSDYYVGFSGDTYEIQSQGNNVAILVGNSWTDLVLMKSTDNGDTWAKTVIWEHPYPMFDFNNMIVTDTFYCADGAHSLAFDNSGKVHVAFGIDRALSDGFGTFWYPLVDGIAYWNEDMPTFSNNLNALSPYGDPGTELITDYNLIGWSQDINGNGQLDVLENIGTYYLGFSSMPQLAIDEMNNIFLVYSSVTEGYDNGIQNYRHLWVRGSNNNGLSWGNFVDLNNDLVYIFSECVFPSVSPSSDNSIHLVFQEDSEPGLAVRGDEDPYEDNHIVYMNILKSDIVSLFPGGDLEGNVTDSGNGNPIEGATVSLSGTSYQATSGADGFYQIVNIPADDYITVCSKMGYLNATINTTIVEDQTIILDIGLGEATNLDPPENLLATVFDEANVLLEWEQPLTGSPVGYRVYRNDELIGYYTTLTTNDYNVDPGTYVYFTTSVYYNGESSPSNTVEITIAEALLPPLNLVATVDDNDVTLTWDPPGGSANPEWIQWDNGINTGNGIGLTDGGSFFVASHWEPSDLINYDGMEISKMSFFPNEDPNATFELMAWTGPNAGTQIISQAVPSFIVDEFNEVDLTSPIIINASTDLWFGYSITHENGSFPAGCDDGPAIIYHGDMISLNGTTWVSMSVDYGLDYNWNLAAYVENADGKMLVNKPVPKVLTNAAEGSFTSSKEQGKNGTEKVFGPKNVDGFLYYNIYSTYNGGSLLFIGSTTATTYVNMDLLPGEYSYCVTAVYDAGESDCSETVYVMLPEPCDPPQNVTASVIDTTDVNVSWDPPATGTALSYNIYRDGALLANTSSTEILFDDLEPGTYEFCVSSICIDGESDLACADSVTIINTLEPPSNLYLIYDQIFILDWQPPVTMVPNGYNLYFKLDNGEYNLIEFNTSNSTEFIPQIGTNYFYVTAVYDEGESDPSNIVSELFTNIDINTVSGITMAPNPASNFVKIESDNAISSIIIYDPLGNRVENEIYDTKMIKLNTSQFPRGLYYFRIETINGITYRKLIIE